MTTRVTEAELTVRLAELLTQAQRTRKPIEVERGGRVVARLLPVEEYDAEDEALMAALARPEVVARVQAAKAGEKLTWEQANAELGLTEEEVAAEIARLEAEDPVAAEAT